MIVMIGCVRASFPKSRRTPPDQAMRELTESVGGKVGCRAAKSLRNARRPYAGALVPAFTCTVALLVKRLRVASILARSSD